MPGHRLVEGHHLGVPAGTRGGPLGVEPVRPGPPAVEAGRGVVRRRAAHGHDIRHGRHLARRRQGLGEELRRPRLGPPHRGRRPLDGLVRGDSRGGVPQRGEHLVQPVQPQAGAQFHGPRLQRRDVVQARPVQFFRRQGQGRVDPDRPGVGLLAARQAGQPGPLRRPGPREQFGDGGHPPGERGLYHLAGGHPAFFLPRRRPRPSPRRPGGEHRVCAGGGQDPFGPGDGLPGQRGDRQPSLTGAVPQPLPDLVEPGAAAPQPGQVGLGRGHVDQHRPGRHRQEGRRPRVLHRGDRVLVRRQVDDLPFLAGRLLRAVERDGLGRGELPAGDRVGLAEKLPELGTPGLLGLLALVRDQIVVPGNAEHGGGERIVFKPAPVYPVGQVTC